VTHRKEEEDRQYYRDRFKKRELEYVRERYRDHRRKKKETEAERG